MISYLFRNILIPLDFGDNTQVAVKQAIELVYGGASDIHLLHIIDTGKVVEADKTSPVQLIHDEEKYCIKGIFKKLNEWKMTIEETVAGVNVKIHVVEGDVYDKIICTAKKIQPQLIILSKKNNYKFLSIFKPLCPDELSRITGCPVLNVMNGSVSSKTKIIVVPIRNFVPRKKIEYLVAFAKMFRTKIHLVALHNKPGEADIVKKSLLETYMILKTVLTNPIEYHLLNGNSYPKASLQFAEAIGADMIFVNPQVETKISSFFGKHINDILEPSSKLKILYLEPYPVVVEQK